MINDESRRKSVSIHRSSFIVHRYLRVGVQQMKSILSLLTLGVVIALAARARAQEAELVNEIVAWVNNGIIARADYLNALRDFREELALQGPGKTEAEIDAEFERLKSSVLDFLIDDLL